MDILSIDSERKGNPSMLTDTEGGNSVRKKIEGRKILKKKLKNAEKENEELKLVIVEKSQEIERLRSNVNSLNDVINSTNIENLGRGSSVASTKIMELSKKNRQLTAELEAVKSKYSKLDARYTKLEKEQSQKTPKSISRESQKKVACCNSAGKLEVVTEQLTTTKQKLFESLNQITELKSSLKLAQKCIQQEIGENVNLNILSASNTTWRGRAQQIIALQNKVAELKERIEMTAMGDEPVKQQFRKFEAAKKAEIEELNQKIQDLNITVEEQRKKIGALKTRNKNLCDDAMNYKIKTLTLMEKSGSSDISISSLQEKINIQKYQYENKMAEMQKQLAAMEELLKQSELDHEQTRARIQNLEYVIQEKDNAIDLLNGSIQKLEDDLKAVAGDFLFSCREFRKEEYVAILDALENEKESLMKLIAELNQRVEEERDKVSNLSDQLAKQRIKYCRLEAKQKEMLKEQEMQQDKKKRSQRAADYSRSLSTGISTLIFENSNSCLVDTPACGDGIDLLVEDYKNKVELANERITFLEEKLAHLTNEHKHDTQTFNEILSSSKNAILQMILESQQKPKSSLNITDSLEECQFQQEEFQRDSLEEASNCSRIFPQDKND